MPPYDEALEWIRFAYTVDWLGDYVDPGSTEMEFSTLLEGKALFTLALRQIQTLNLGSYARGSTSTIDPWA